MEAVTPGWVLRAEPHASGLGGGETSAAVSPGNMGGGGTSGYSTADHSRMMMGGSAWGWQ